MDSKEFKGLMEAYSEVYAPQEEIDEAVKGASRHDTEMRKADAAERRAGVKNRLSPSAGKANAEKMERDIKFYNKITKKTKPSVVGMTHEETELDESNKENKQKKNDTVSKIIQKKLHPSVLPSLTYGRRELKKEELDIFDVVLEFLQAEGFAETLEEAQWLMANVIDEEAIGIILGEGHGSRRSFKRQSEDERWRVKTFNRPGSKVEYTPHKNYDPEANRGQGQILRPNQAEKQRRKKLAQSAMGEDYVNEAQVANRDPEKYEREQEKKYAPVRGERTPMPPRGDKRREDFEKWYAKNVR